jgi:general secretion pathway protein D
MKRSLALLFGFTVLAGAQEPEKQIPPPGIPGFPGAAPAAPEKTTSEPGRVIRASKEHDPNAIAVAEGDSILRPEMTGIDASELYYKYTRKRVILSSQASTVQAYFVQKGPLTNAEAAKLLEITLLMEGLSVLPDPLDPNIVRIVASGPTPPNITTTQYIDDPLDIPLTDQMITYRMHFKNLKPDEALRVFQQVLGGNTPGGSITAVTNASSLIIKENSSLIRQLIKLQKAIDVSSEIDEAWIKLVFADVDDVAAQLNEIYNQQSAGNSTTRTRRAGSTAPPGLPTAAGGSSGAGEEIPLRILPNIRTGRILLVGRTTDIVTARALIQGYDIPSSTDNDFTYRLKFLRVGEFLPIAYDAIEATLSPEAAGAGGGAGARTNQAQTNRTTNNNNNNNAGGAGAAGGGSRTALQAQDIPTAPEAQIVGGKTLLVANNIENSIIVKGPPHHIQIVKSLLEGLDTEGDQVVISAVIGSYGLGDNMNFGIELAQLIQGTQNGGAGRFSFDSGSGTPATLDPRTLTDLAGLLTATGAGGSGMSLYGAFDDFGVFVNALEGTSNFKSLDRPVITTRNNRVARISSGQRIAIPANTFTGGVNNGGTTTNIEYEDVVLELEIQPLINGPDKVTLEISLVRDDIGNNRTVGELTVPDISTEELTTTVTVENGAAIILGGLITDDERKTVTGVPYLSRIPGIGNLFKSTTKSGGRNELVVILRPQIISNTHQYREFRDGYETESPFTLEARESLPNTGLLPPKGALAESATPQAKPQEKSLLTAPSKTKSRSVHPPTKSGAGFMKFRRRR